MLLLHIVKLMLKQSVVSLIVIFFINFSFDKLIFSILQVFKDHERLLILFVLRFTLCGIGPTAN